jgi:hypothetical protein
MFVSFWLAIFPPLKRRDDAYGPAALEERRIRLRQLRAHDREITTSQPLLPPAAS